MGKFFAKIDKKDFKRSIPNAPRARTDRLSILNVKLYKLFKKKHPNIDIKNGEFTKLITRGNELMAQAVVQNREGVVLPERLGRLFIGAYEKGEDTNYYNWATLQKENIAVNHRNWDSDRYFCKIFYTSFGDQYDFQFKRYWYFNPCRYLQELTSKSFRINWNMYVKVPRFQKLSELEKEMNYETIKIVHHEPNRRRTDFTNTQPH